MCKYSKLFLVFIYVLCLKESFAELTDAECKELGYTRQELTCDICDKFDEFGLEIIKPECLQCCTANTESTNINKRYPKAVLEVCTCKFRAYPQIEAFIKSNRPAKFPNLQIKYLRGLDPAIKLLDSKGNVQETLSITKWNTDTVEEFLETHLEKLDSNYEKDEDDEDNEI